MHCFEADRVSCCKITGNENIFGELGKMQDRQNSARDFKKRVFSEKRKHEYSVLSGYFKPGRTLSLLITVALVLLITASLQYLVVIYEFYQQEQVQMYAYRRGWWICSLILCWLLPVCRIGALIFECSLAGDNKLKGLYEFDWSISYNERLNELYDWIFRTVWLLLISSIPGVLLVFFVQIVSGGAKVNLTQMAIGCLFVSVFIFMPVFLLSSLSNESNYDFISKEVFRSIKSAFSSWRDFYSAAILILFVFTASCLLFYGLIERCGFAKSVSGSEWTRGGNAVLVSGFTVLIVLALYFYLRLLGKLGWVIENKINESNDDE